MAIGFVGGAFSTASTTAGTTNTISYVPTAGNTLIVFGCGIDVVGVTGVTDSAGNKYYPCQTVTSESTGPTVTTFSTNAGAALTTAGNTITVTFGSSTRNTCVIVEYSGVVGIAAVSNATHAATTTASIVQTIQNANNWIVAAFAVEGTA